MSALVKISEIESANVKTHTARVHSGLDGHSDRYHVVILANKQGLTDRLAKLARSEQLYVTHVSSPDEMQDVLSLFRPDLILMNAESADLGLKHFIEIRRNSSVPMILLPDSSDAVSRANALDIGFEDCLPRPFDVFELAAKIRAILRRRCCCHAAATAGKLLKFGNWILDPTNRELLDECGLPASLTSIEFDLLLAFCNNPRRVLTRDELLDLVHLRPIRPGCRTIDVHVSRIRQSVERDPKEPRLIKTVRLGGYFFTPYVESIAAR